MSASVFPRLLADSNHKPHVPSSHWVVLLHGLFATRRSMRRLEDRLTQAGYKTINWDYRTVWKTAEDHVRRLRPLIENLQSDPQVAAIHFVTHSMGGILVRYALHGHSTHKIQRIVMLAPPSRGSHLTRLPLGPFARLFPIIADLSESVDSLPNRLVDCSRLEIGVVAAAHDLVVTVAATHLANQREHCTIATNHFRLPYHEDAIAKVQNFLATGSFGSRQNSNLAANTLDHSNLPCRAREAA